MASMTRTQQFSGQRTSSRHSLTSSRRPFWPMVGCVASEPNFVSVRDLDKAHASGDTPALCAGLRSFSKVRQIVRHHHERLDGSGYPDGLRNGKIPLLAQIVGIVDVFDALTSERPYRAARSREEGFEVLAEEAKKGWRDRALVDAFIAVT